VEIENKDCSKEFGSRSWKAIEIESKINVQNEDGKEIKIKERDQEWESTLKSRLWSGLEWGLRTVIKIRRMLQLKEEEI
jgi:hypothetical protein